MGGCSKNPGSYEEDIGIQRSHQVSLREGVLLLVFIKLNNRLRLTKFTLSTEMIEMLTKAIVIRQILVLLNIVYPL